MQTQQTTLLLNADYSPLKVIPWEEAINLILDEKAYQVECYSDRMIHSAHDAFEWPAVIAYTKYSKRAQTKVRLNRANLMARDGYKCMYCGCRPRNAQGRPHLEALTLEHIVPRAQAVDGMVVLPWSGKRVPVTSWENVVAACGDCNSRKANRTPAEAGMKLLGIPTKPAPWTVLMMSFLRSQIPSEWQAFLPVNSEWREYWSIELDET